VSGRPSPHVTWSLDGADVLETTTSDVIRVTHDRETGRCRLEISEVIPEDEGTYTATAVNQLGTASTSAYVTVQRDREPEEELYSSGEETTDTWTVENKKIFEEFNQVEIDVDLKRSAVSATSQRPALPLEVREAPVFSRQLESLDVFESTPIRLECDVTGYPQPDITWYQDGRKIETGDHIQLDYNNGHCSLSIDRVTIDDEAEYVCEARNDYGTASTWAELLVEKLIAGLEKMVVDEFYEVEIEMNFKWKEGQKQRPRTPTKIQATIN